MYINDDNDFKKKSLEDNVYFTLRDIFWNCNSADTCDQSNSYNNRLTGGICFEERTDKFKYTNVLYEKDYVERLQRWLNNFNQYYFEFSELEEGEEIDVNIKETFILNEFINKIKNSNKEQVQIAFKNKNKIWFPLVYNDESTKLKFTATNTTIIELSKNNYYIIFKDDERNIPIMGIYFYEPKVDDCAYLNEKIGSYLITDKYRTKLETKLSDTYSTFEELIKDYQIDIPLNRIDEDDYNYSSLTILLKKLFF